MSKSYNNVIDVFLPDKHLRKQIMSIKTDSTAMEEPKDADSCNVFKLYKLLASDVQSKEIKEKYNAGNYGYGEAKQELFELICDKYKSERERFKNLMQNKHILDAELAKGAEKARIIAREVLDRVRKNIGY